MSISSVGQATAGEVNAASIKNTKILFTPGTRIKEMLDAVKFQKE